MHLQQQQQQQRLQQNPQLHVQQQQPQQAQQQQNHLQQQQSRALDSQLWHACAGGMVQLPSTGAKVIYFPQGHAEQAAGSIDFSSSQLNRAIGPAGSISCRVISVDFLADRDTDEVFAKIKLSPEPFSAAAPFGNDDAPTSVAAAPVERPTSFAKTLTQSDANNGGGFSVPRYCAETIFPRLDLSNDPPVQTVYARDVHGEVWKFRHIYRGTPRRHLLTTGWSSFVNQKKLVAGDAIVFLRSSNGELRVGVRRSMRGPGGGDSWHSSSAVMSTNGASNSSRPRWSDSEGSSSPGASFARNRARVPASSVVEAASLAASGHDFEVVYYPRASTAEFCVRAGVVKAALENTWYAGMRFKMAFETEDSSRISWFMGTIAAVQPADRIRWPSSPWRILQVTWDEPDLLQGVSRVSPWQVEVVAPLPMQFPQLSIRKNHKFRHGSQPLELQFGDAPPAGLMGLPMAALANNVLGHWQSLSEEIPAGMQGARHERFFGLTLPEYQPRQPRVQAGLALDGIYPLQQHLGSFAGGAPCGRGGSTMDLKLNSYATPTLDYFQVHKNSDSVNFNSCSLAFEGGGGAAGVNAAALAINEAAPTAAATPTRKRMVRLFGTSIDPNEPPQQQQQQQQQLAQQQEHQQKKRHKSSSPATSASSSEPLQQQVVKESSPPSTHSNNSSFDDSRADNNKPDSKPMMKKKQSFTSSDLRLCQGDSPPPDSGVTNEGVSWVSELEQQQQQQQQALVALSPEDNAMDASSSPNDNSKNVISCCIKIFFENEEVGRTLDLSSFGTYDEVYDKLALMFTVDKSKLSGRVVYKDVEGSTIHMGGEPYRNFVNSVRRLRILAIPSSSSTGSGSAQSW